MSDALRALAKELGQYLKPANNLTDCTQDVIDDLVDFEEERNKVWCTGCDKETYPGYKSDDDKWLCAACAFKDY